MHILLTAFVLVIVFWAVGAYQRLARQRGQCRVAWSPITAHLLLHHELVPALFERARGYLDSAQPVLESVIPALNQAVTATEQARQRPYDQTRVKLLAQAEHALNATLETMCANLREREQFQSDAQLQQLIQDLEAAQHKLAIACVVYNAAVVQYNTERSQFPSAIIATVFAFRPVTPFSSTESES